MRWRMRIGARSRTQEISCGGLSCEVMHSEVICTMCSEVKQCCRTAQAGLCLGARGILFVNRVFVCDLCLSRDVFAHHKKDTYYQSIVHDKADYCTTVYAEPCKVTTAGCGN